MAENDVATQNVLIATTLILMVASHRLPPIHLDLPGLTWQALTTAEPCFKSDPAGCMLGP